MNEREKAEFEHHKRAAEEQLNKMYYGTGGKSQNKSGLAMPNFLAPPKQQQRNATHSNTTNFNTTSESKSQNKSPVKEANIAEKKENSGKGSILNLLNFKGLKMDNDRLVILAVCLLLAGDEVDELLMLALMYIML